MEGVHRPIPVQPLSSRLARHNDDDDDHGWASSTNLHPSITSRPSLQPEHGTPEDDGLHMASTRHRQPKRQWRKLLYIDQPYPDNWVDPTFLKDLQRNTNVQPYNFYSLVAESTVVVQHVSAMVIFITAFMAIYDNRISPISVAGISTALTVAGWTVWELGWGMREAARERAAAVLTGGTSEGEPSGKSGGNPSRSATPGGKGLGIEMTSNSGHPKGQDPSDNYFPPYGRDGAGPSFPGSPVKNVTPAAAPPVQDHSKSLRRARIFNTAKSALLIYFTLLGLSPILRSLTKSISEDSIWAIATWLFIANLLGFDYGSGTERKFPAPFPTNVAITAAVVLASRLPSTTHVFSLMLFSIQVFGLFPVFRRYIKHLSWRLHVILTVSLVFGAAGGLGYAVGWGWAVMYIFTVIAGMGGCGWWMIDLQKYKNEIHGPWDPARPILRRQWE